MRDWAIHQWKEPVPYQGAWESMKQFTDSRGPDSQDMLWLMQHPPVYTQGLAGRPEHLLNPQSIPVVRSDRGGQITYHGPGQLMLYSLFDIDRMGLGTRDFVRQLEAVIVALLADYGIHAAGRVDAPGVYVGDKKIASIGLRVKKGRSYHGCALNVDGDLEPFSGINPCGFHTLEMTCIAAHAPVSLDQLVRRVSGHFATVFGFSAPRVMHHQSWESYEFNTK